MGGVRLIAGVLKPRIPAPSQLPDPQVNRPDTGAVLIDKAGRFSYKL